MNGSSSISLRFGASVPNRVRSRISYAFRVFAAIYNYRVEEDASREVDFCCAYGETAGEIEHSSTLRISARYRVKPPEERLTSLTRHQYAGQEFHLAYGLDSAGRPDWLGEIFEWLSSSYELRIARRDTAGRISYSETILNHCDVPHQEPHASLLMSWLENAMRNGNSRETLPRAPSPEPSYDHVVVCTHDIDFYAGSTTATLIRLLKNLALAGHPYRSSSYFRDNLAMLTGLLNGREAGRYLPKLTERIGSCGFGSTSFVVPRRAHRRDPNYEIRQIAPALRQAMSMGFSVGLHGSYRSVVEDGSLALEAELLEKAIGKRPLGGRQHWLRFDSHEKLFEQVAEAALRYDSSLGFSENVGFRNGASFAFPPYDFKCEQAHSFLEIPLILMDGGLEAESRERQEEPQALAEKVLGGSRQCGWGGVSVLWHNPIEALSVPKEINDVFWKCAGDRHKFREVWQSADEFFPCALRRYQQAGLLLGVKLRDEDKVHPGRVQADSRTCNEPVMPGGIAS